MPESLDLYINEAKKIPDICNDYVKYRNCKYDRKYFIMNEDGPILKPQNCKDCPKICPEYLYKESKI